MRRFCIAAGEIKTRFLVSFADAFVGATAQRFGALLIHKDPEFESLKSVVKSKALPYKTACLIVGWERSNCLRLRASPTFTHALFFGRESFDSSTQWFFASTGTIYDCAVTECSSSESGARRRLCAAGVILIKPENIMLRPDGYVKVLDFGIAKLAESAFAKAAADGAESMTVAETNLGAVLGSVRYMSPEQAGPAVGGIDKRTDIWSLGVVLYEMVTDHTPFSGDTPGEVMSAILKKEPPPLTNYVAHTPAELQQIISKTLRKDRKERYASAHELLRLLKNLRHKLEVELERAAAPLWLRWARSPAAPALVVTIGALALALPFYHQRNLATTPRPGKSIAVLPFKNLSKDEENAFAGGVQDEILTDLAKIADLKVISRTSVMKYKTGLERNLREIATTLGVSHVVEGSVQRAGGRVRVNVQLIDARNDAHLWAEHYDRDVADVFAVQSEIAQRIADELKANLSPAEKAAIAQRPTADLVAYALYTKAREIDIYGNWEGAGN